MMKPLAEAVEPGADFFVEDVAITAIVFDADDDDVTLWASSVFDEQIYFFHLAASFAELSTLLRLAGERGSAIDLEVANALAGESAEGDETAEESSAATDQKNTDAEGDTDDEDGEDGDEESGDEDDDDDDDLHPTILEFVTDERPPMVLPDVALKLAFTYTDEENTEPAFNIFSLVGIYLQMQ